jgi:hypothetical protein
LPQNLATTTIFVDWRYAVPALYVGTSRGVYHSVDRGQHWQKFGKFMPNTTVSDLQYLNPQQEILAAATAGRGAWEILIPPSSISGQVYWDHNGNAVQDVGDNGLPAAVVFLDVNGNAAIDNFEYVAVTDAQGNYAFSSVPPGTYSLRQIPPAGFMQTTPPINNLILDGSNLGGLKFGDSFASFQAVTAAVIDAIQQRQLRLLDVFEKLYADPDFPGGRSYSPFSLAPGETRIPPRTETLPGRRRPKSDEPLYIDLADLDFLLGRLPGEPVGAKGEFDDGRTNPR